MERGKEEEKDNRNPMEEISLAHISEDVLAQRAKTDDRALEYLLLRYKNMVRAKARSYFLMGGDHEDILQEGMIGLYKAVRDYKQEMGGFRGFAELCIVRQILSAVKTANRKKHLPLNHYVSIHRSLYEGERGDVLADSLTQAQANDPAEILLSEEGRIRLEEHIKRELSEMERTVLAYYLQGLGYGEIARAMGRPQKSVDNALQRIKNKLMGFL